MRLSLTYFDQNEEFGALLPRCGTVECFVRSRAQSEWALFRLDQPVEYRNSVYNQLLLRSRWRGCRIGERESTSVHVVLVPDEAEVRDGFSVDRANHVAWGMAERLAELS